MQKRRRADRRRHQAKQEAELVEWERRLLASKNVMTGVAPIAPYVEEHDPNG